MKAFEHYLSRNKTNISISFRALGLTLALLIISYFLPHYQLSILILLAISCGLIAIFSLEAGSFFFLAIITLPIFYSSVEIGLIYILIVFLLFTYRNEISMQTFLLFTLFIALSRLYLPFGILMIAAIYLGPEAFWFGLFGCLTLETLGLLYGASSISGIFTGGTSPIWNTISNLPPINDLSWIPTKFSESSFLQIYQKLFKSFIGNPLLLVLPLFWGGVGAMVSKFSQWKLRNVFSVFA